MLNAMREGAKSGVSKFILFTFMVMAVGGLVVMDVGGVFRGGVTRTAVAKIDGEELPIIVFDRNLRRVLARQGLDVQTAYQLGFVQQVLRNEISNNLIQRAALDMGLRVNDPLVLKQVNKIIEPMVTEDMDKKQALSAVLRSQGLGEREFINMIKAEMTNTLLRNTLLTGTDIPPRHQGMDLYQYSKEKRTINVVHLPHSAIKDIAEPDDAILLPFYQAGQERYAIAETRTFSIAAIAPEQLEKTLDISDEELREIYQRDIDSYAVPEKRKLEQIIVDDQSTADAIFTAINKGKSLKDAVIAETESEDAYLGSETFEKDGLLPDIADTVFSAEKGNLIGPIETALGWHIIKLQDIIAPETKSFAAVKNDLKKEILHMRVADEMFEIGNEIDDRLAGGMTLEEVAAEMNLTITQYGPVKSDGTTLDSKDGMKKLNEEDRTDVLILAYELLEGEISPVMELSDGRYAALRVDAITPKSYKPFEDVKDDLAKIWIQDQKEVSNKLKAAAALRALNMEEKTLKDIASENNVAIKTYNLVRGEDPKEPITNTAKTLFYKLDNGQHGLAPAPDGYILGRLTAIDLPDISEAGEGDFKTFTDSAERSIQNEIMQLYFAQLQSRYKVKINERLLLETYGPGSEQF